MAVTSEQVSGGRAASAPSCGRDLLCASAPVSSEALARLADRFRPAGLFIVALACDGTVVFHDSKAGAFFRKYVLPCIQNRQTLAAQSGIVPQISISDAIPGVTLATF